MTSAPTRSVFSPLPAQALEEFSDARKFISQTAVDLLGVQPLSQTGTDLLPLQALANHAAMRHANYEAWVALGIAFGDALAARIPGLHWRQVSDASGKHAALQFEQKSLSIAAPTMLWKRVERGEPFDLEHMVRELRTFIEVHVHEVGDA